MKYKIVVFDLDGTILNTLEDLADSTNYALSVFDMPERTIEEIRLLLAMGKKADGKSCTTGNTRKHDS